MEDVDVDVGWPMSIIIPACMHSIEPGLGILSARRGEDAGRTSTTKPRYVIDIIQTQKIAGAAVSHMSSAVIST